MVHAFKNQLQAAFLIGAVAGLTACGGQNAIIKDAKLDLTQQNGESVATLTTEINTGAVPVSAVSFPVHLNNKDYGKVEITKDVTTGKSYLVVSINVQQALNLPSPQFNSMLPNGTAVPLAGIDLTKLMAFNVGNTNSKVYLYIDTAAKKAVIGAAINISALALGTNANAFIPFAFSNVSGMAGIYLGAQPGTSGVGVFADLSGLLPSATVSVHSELAKASGEVGFVPSSFSPQVQKQFNWRLYELSVSGTPLTAD